MIITVKQNQTIFDISMMYTGSTENVIAILEHNNKGTAPLTIGEELVIPDELVNSKIVDFFKGNNSDAATSSVPLNPSQWTPPAPAPNSSVALKVNNIFYKTVNAPSTVDLPLKYPDGNNTSFTYSGDDIVIYNSNKWQRPKERLVVPNFDTNEQFVVLLLAVFPNRPNQFAVNVANVLGCEIVINTTIPSIITTNTGGDSKLITVDYNNVASDFENINGFRQCWIAIKPLNQSTGFSFNLYDNSYGIKSHNILEAYLSIKHLNSATSHNFGYGYQIPKLLEIIKYFHPIPSFVSYGIFANTYSLKLLEIPGNIIGSSGVIINDAFANSGLEDSNQLTLRGVQMGNLLANNQNNNLILDFINSINANNTLNNFRGKKIKCINMHLLTTGVGTIMAQALEELELFGYRLSFNITNTSIYGYDLFSILLLSLDNLFDHSISSKNIQVTSQQLTSIGGAGSPLANAFTSKGWNLAV